MSDYSLYARVVRPEAVMEAAYGLASSPRPLSADEISRFIEKGERYTQSVINLGQELELIYQSGDKYRADSDIEKELRQAEKEQRSLLLKKYVLQYEPFMTFLSFLLKGYDRSTSAKNTDVLYDLGLDESKLENQFSNLGEWTDILSEEEIEIEIKSLSRDYLKKLEEAIESKASARIFLEQKLGEDVFAYLGEELIEDLITGIQEFEDSPREAIGAVGRAVEDFQRDIGNNYGKEGEYREGIHGIGQLSGQMQREDWSMSRHLHGGKYLSAMRNPSGGHGYNPETLERWEVRSDVGLDYILASLHYIRSVYRMAESRRQVL